MWTFTKIKYGLMCVGALLAPAFEPVVVLYNFAKPLFSCLDKVLSFTCKVLGVILGLAVIAAAAVSFHHWGKMQSEVEFYYNILKKATDLTFVNPTLINFTQVEEGNILLDVGLEIIRMLV